jgi:hypothetical protein
MLPPVIKLPPVMLPVAEIEPEVLMLPPTTFPVNDAILAVKVPVLGTYLRLGSSAKTV